MAEEIKVDETTDQNATDETTEPTVEVDYEKELDEATQRIKRQQENWEAGKRRISEKKGQESEEDIDPEERLVSRLKSELFPSLQATIEENTRNQRLDTASKGNPSLRRLIAFHLDNSVNPKLDFDTRLEHAVAIANKGAIEKKVREINTALRNREQISSSAQGANQETHQRPGKNIVSDAQLKELQHRAETYGRAAGWDEKTKAKFVEDALNRLAQNR